jgi:hypothetical protein
VSAGHVLTAIQLLQMRARSRRSTLVMGVS